MSKHKYQLVEMRYSICLHLDLADRCNVLEANRRPRKTVNCDEAYSEGFVAFTVKRHAVSIMGMTLPSIQNTEGVTDARTDRCFCTASWSMAQLVDMRGSLMLTLFLAFRWSLE